MDWIRNATLVLLLGAPPAAVARDSQDEPISPAEQYQALLQERDRLPEELSRAKTAEEGNELRGRLTSLPRRFLELAESHPNDAIAVDALLQTVGLVNTAIFPICGENTPGDRALALLVRDHVQSDKLGLACQQVITGFHSSQERFLRAVVERNPHREVQGLACLSLAQFLTDRMHRLDILEAQEGPELGERYQRVFGADLVQELRQQDRGVVAKEAEALFVRALEQYGDVNVPVTYYGSGGTVGKKAAEELFQIRNLAVGKEAPDIEGEDQNGVRFKLSDYRGRVVLLDFWHHL
jgi:hypothetical protein